MSDRARHDGPFKTCTCCSSSWNTRDDLLSDGEVSLAGYQADFVRLELGLLLFTHAPCKSTFGIPAREFQSLYAGPVYAKPLTASRACPGHCLSADELRPCPNACECSWVREVLQVVRRHLSSAALKLAAQAISGLPLAHATPSRPARREPAARRRRLR